MLETALTTLVSNPYAVAAVVIFGFLGTIWGLVSLCGLLVARKMTRRFERHFKK